MNFIIKINHLKKLKKSSKFFQNQLNSEDFAMKIKKNQKKMKININQCFR